MINPLPLLLLFLQFGPTPPRVPATQPDPGYPLRVHLIVVKSQGYAGDYRGFGRGDILAPGGPIGFDYTDSCGSPFMNNRQPGEFYQARWKKQDYKLEILLQDIGSSRLSRCELQVSLKQHPYNYPGLYKAPPPPPPAQ